ncbi:c-type cytochrome [Pedobacter sp. BS3]|uniref:c-type cytochrome n=1 Tax=Pedobacter sp. BS3 TaxID=2567937 RepID=UPI0011F0614D|nr:c-type cytochrome [Pedobacter sp. BS3]TZF81446.1 c-type cytochrome [Pedobacter sp. BS3]
MITRKILACLIVFVSHNLYAQKGEPKTTKVNPIQSTSTIGIEEGKALIAKADCFACHKIQEKLVGPAYVDIAKKYTATNSNITMLADKIIKGGSGVWGSIPMAPHASISVIDAKKIVRYILSLDKK